MSASEARYYLQLTKRKYLLFRILEMLLTSCAIFLAIVCICTIVSIQNEVTLPIALLGGLIYFIFRGSQLNILKVQERGVAQYINQHYAQMEESTDLLIREDHELTSLQQLQKLKSIQQFESLYPIIKLPNNLKEAFIIFFMSSLTYAGISALYHPAKIDQLPSENIGQSLIPPELFTSIEKAVITIIPPSYTRKEEQNTSSFNMHIPEGSTVQWLLTFTGAVKDPRLIFSGKDTVGLSPGKERQFRAQRSFSSAGFYQISWKNSDGSKKYSDYFEVEVINDQPPSITVKNLNQSIEFKLTDNPKIDLKTSFADDYGLRDAYLIATVSKGSGEAIKFREEKLRFHTPAKIEGQNIDATLSIDILKLGLDPGDELYFYVEALDNKLPLMNRSRTETFFISLQDTSSITTSIGPGLGVDLMPEYFRSQRQIIIDSEKLLSEKKNIRKESFNARSNELGHDQKVLRLRYGEFLGEEFESGFGNQSATPGQNNHEEEDVTKQYGHVHDKQDTQGAVEEKSVVTATDDQTDGAKAHEHTHDNNEEATFFTRSIRAKLKAAINIMWDAELHLRLNKPEKSLPFQYRALKLLKEISQDSRIYVHRAGFDPPPLKEERRLTGDLTEIKNSNGLNSSTKNESYPNIRNASRYIEQFLTQNEITFTPPIKDVFVKAGQELSTVAIEQPGRYLKSLSLLKALIENELDPAAQKQALLEIRSSFWSLLPAETASPLAGSRTEHLLDNRFLKNLKALKQK